MGLKKQYVVIKYNDKPILVCPVVEGDSASYLATKKEAEKNLNNLFTYYEFIIKGLGKEIEDLKKEVKHLKGED